MSDAEVDVLFALDRVISMLPVALRLAADGRSSFAKTMIEGDIARLAEAIRTKELPLGPLARRLTASADCQLTKPGA